MGNGKFGIEGLEIVWKILGKVIALIWRAGVWVTDGLETAGPLLKNVRWPMVRLGGHCLI